MTSNLTSQMAAEANKDHNNPLVFVRIDYPYPNDTALGVTSPFPITLTGTGDPDLDGQTFTPLDSLTISDYKQDVSGGIQEIGISLSASDSSPFVELLDDDDWWGAPSKVWFAYFDSADLTSVIFSPSLRISGFLDKLPLTVDEDISHVTAVIRSNRMLFERDRGNRYVSAQHEARYPTDLAFSFLPRLVSGELLLANDKPVNVRRFSQDGGEFSVYDNYQEL